MTKISSGTTKLYKRIFPAVWFGLLAAFVLGAFATGALGRGQWMLLIGPLFMVVIGYALMRHLLWDLVDEVYDLGDALLVKNRGEEERIPLSNIMNVSAALMVNPPRVTLRLAQPNRFGEEITFTPPVPIGFNRFRRNPVVDDLIVRVDKARTKRLMS